MVVTEDYIEFPVPVSTLKRVLKKAQKAGKNAVVFEMDLDLKIKIHLGDMEGIVTEIWE